MNTHLYSVLPVSVQRDIESFTVSNGGEVLKAILPRMLSNDEKRALSIYDIEWCLVMSGKVFVVDRVKTIFYITEEKR